MGKFTYMLDTNILSELIRNPAGTVARGIRHHGEDRVCTSIIVACELRFGAAKKGVAQLTARVDSLLASIEVLPFCKDADHRYALLRAHLEKTGTPIGPNDMLLAAHALNQGVILVADNEGEFGRVPGLMVENWLNQF